MSSNREAKALLAAGKFREAGVAFESAGNPKQAVLAYGQGECWLDLGRVLEGVRRYEESAAAYARGGEFARAAAVAERWAVRLQERGKAVADQKKAIRWAVHYHGKGGNPGKAAELLELIDEPTRAAEWLAKAGFFEQAAERYVALGMPGQAIDVLVRGKAPGAAAKIARAEGDHLLAGKLYRADGDHARAVDAFEAAGAWGDVAMEAEVLEQWARAGEAFERADKPLAAGRCYLAAEQADAAINALAEIKYDDPVYIEAVPLAVDALERKGTMSFRGERFLQDFLLRPVDEASAALIYRLGRVYEQGEFWETAEELYEKLLAYRPGYEDVAERLPRMVAYQKDSAAVFKQVMKEDFEYEETTRRMADRRRRVESQEGDLEGFPQLPDASEVRPAAPPVAASPEPAGNPARLAEGDADTWTGAQAADEGRGEEGAALVRLEPGMRLGDRYELSHRIGAGGRGVVFAAHDRELDETVALKALHPMDTSEESLIRFRQELKLARKLTHPNIIRVHDIGQVDGLRFITMEYLDGHDLEQAITASPGTFPIDTGVDYARQICDGLTAAHELGIIHRDIKPPNVMVVEPATIKILDFGIAKAMDTEGISATGMACGTPLYMSPEQIRGGRALDPRPDLYSLGCVLFALFTGQVPFRGDEVFELLMAHINEPPPRPRDLRPDLPRDLEGVILRLLAKSPGDRFATAAELRAALERVG